AHRLVFLPGDLTVFVAVDLREPILDGALRSFRGVDDTVLIGVALLDDFVEGAGNDAVGLVAAGRPAGRIQNTVVAYDGSHVDDSGHAADGPDFPACFKIVANDAQRRRDDHLLFPANLPDHRRAVISRKLRTVDLP